MTVDRSSVKIGDILTEGSRQPGQTRQVQTVQAARSSVQSVGTNCPAPAGTAADLRGRVREALAWA